MPAINDPQQTLPLGHVSAVQPTATPLHELCAPQDRPAPMPIVPAVSQQTSGACTRSGRTAPARHRPWVPLPELLPLVLLPPLLLPPLPLLAPLLPPAAGRARGAAATATAASTAIDRSIPDIVSRGRTASMRLRVQCSWTPQTGLSFRSWQATSTKVMNKVYASKASLRRLHTSGFPLRLSESGRAQRAGEIDLDAARSGTIRREGKFE